ncbi:hypothetical protein DFH11DRAFT_1539496 [Phellopilus nigrolimitatus]|nr:hypothetical protein DFH11DRAFT_1539496 [Phellopilus nigrolimitatus]
MTFLTTILNGQQKNSSSFLLLQSSTAQSALPVLRGILDAQAAHELDGKIFKCLTGPRKYEGTKRNQSVGKTGLAKLRETVKAKPKLRATSESSRPVTVVVDSVDTLHEDLESPSETYKFLSQILSSLHSRKDTSHLICHLTSLSPLLPLLIQPSFSSSLTYLVAHPPVLLMHIASAYLTPPPPPASDASSSENLKFWRAFIPLAERARDVERLVFGADGAGGAGGGPSDELVVEVLVRGRGGDAPISNAGPGSGRRRGVERVLEGWCAAKGGSVTLEELDSLRGVWRRKAAVEQIIWLNFGLDNYAFLKDAPDPTKNLTFNLSLTESQQASRSQVPLPYEHDGKMSNQSQNAHIFYDPDSADDLDDEDPDEDLDI